MLQIQPGTIRYIVNLRIRGYGMLVLSVMAFQISCGGQHKVMEYRDLAPFQSIEASGATEVYLEQGDKLSVLLEVDEIDTLEVITKVAKGNLKISLRKGKVKISGLFSKNRVKAYVNYNNPQRWFQSENKQPSVACRMPV